MILTYVTVFFIPIVALHASEEAEVEEPCCYPQKLSGKTIFQGIKLNTFYIDYGRNMIVEDWSGKLSTNYIVYDMTANKKYRLMTSGECRTYPLSSIGNYAQCIPKEAEEVGEKANKVSYGYQLGDVNVVRTVNKETCLPTEITKSRGGRAVVMKYKTVTGIDDENVFEVDVSHCD